MSKPRKQCEHAGCRVMVDYNVTFCPKHTKQRNKETYEKRKGKYFDFYQTKQWRNLSKSYRVSHPYCEQCYQRGIIRPAEICDHIIEVRKDWDKRLDWDNLQSLCQQCHEMKHKRFYRKQQI